MGRPVVFGIIISCILVGIVIADILNPASQQQTKAITRAIKDPITVIKSAALKSSRHRNSYYVGLNFVAHDLEMIGIGIWLVDGDPHKPKVVYSINATALVFSKYPKASRLKNLILRTFVWMSFPWECPAIMKSR